MMTRLRPRLTRIASQYPASVPRLDIGRRSRGNDDQRGPAGRTRRICGDGSVLRPAEKVPPLGANAWGRCGSIEFAANNFVRNPGNEPIHRRELHRVSKCGPGWFEVEGPGTSWFDLYASGLFSGASARIYRLVDSAGKALPRKGNYLDITRADHVILVGKTHVLPEGSEGFPEGGWVVARYSAPFPNGIVGQGNLRCTDNDGIVNGREYFYMVTALGPGERESDPTAR